MLVRITLLAVCACLPAISLRAEDQFEEVRELIQKELKDRQVPSLAVAVAKDGEVLWEEGFGWADREGRVESNEHTLYSLASISKPITATGLMVLVQRSEFQLDDPINPLLPGNKVAVQLGDESDVTVRRLANHTAGLPLHYQFFYADEPLRKPSFEDSLARYGVTVAPPGERYQYANFGYGILDYLISSRSGKSYADFMRERVFLPLGMTRTLVGTSSADLGTNAAVRYAPDQTPLPFYDFDHRGASAVFSSAHDLVRFGMFHLHQRQEDQVAILSRGSIDMMQEPTAEIEGSRHYGVGWFVNEDEHGLKTVYHSGGMGGVRTRLTLVPDLGLTVVALCNTSNDLPMKVTNEILATFDEDFGLQMRKARKHEPGEQPPLPSCPPELVGYWAGAVRTQAGSRRMELWAHADGDVQIRFAGGLRTLLNRSSLRDGRLTGVFSGDLGTEDANRRPYHLHLAARLRGETINGAVTAITLPSNRTGNALSHWVELKRASTDPTTRAAFNGHDLDGWSVPTRFDFERHGRVWVENGELKMAAGNPATGIVYRGRMPRYDYELTLDARREAGSDFFCGLTFPVHKDYLTLIVGGWGGGVVGISNLDGMSAVENETTGYTEFKLNQWYSIRLRVAGEKIQVWIDDEQMIDLDTKGRRRSIWWEQEPMRPLGIASWYTRAALRNIRLRRLVPEK